MYRIGFPFWKTYAKLFGKINLRVLVTHDQDAQVYIATSPDLSGFVVEAANIDELVQEANDVINMLIADKLHNDKTTAVPIYSNLGTAVPNR